MWIPVLLLIWSSPTIGPAPQEPVSGSARRELQVDATFVDTTTGQWTQHEKPVLEQKPTIEDFRRASRNRKIADFGLSFNCQVAARGTLEDCRPLYVAPEVADAMELAKLISPFVRLSRDSANLARKNAYRVTINGALNTVDQSGMPRSCNPPFCMIEGAVPPPPPPQPQDPAARDALARSEVCYSERWEQARVQRFAAEKAVRESSPQPGSNQARAAALAYVRSRQALMDCVVALEKASRALPLSAQDRDIIQNRLKGMRSGYFGQTKYETAILVGLLDKEAAATEETYFYPY